MSVVAIGIVLVTVMGIIDDYNAKMFDLEITDVLFACLGQFECNNILSGDLSLGYSKGQYISENFIEHLTPILYMSSIYYCALACPTPRIC